jgi:NADH-quinone oxidoreductase subunit N
MGAALFSLAGFPPLAGFFGKYNVLLAAVKGGQIWLAVIGVLASVVAAAYYLRVVKVMAFDPPPEEELVLLQDKPLYVLALMMGATTLIFVMLPAPLMNAAQKAAESLLIR